MRLFVATVVRCLACSLLLDREKKQQEATFGGLHLRPNHTTLLFSRVGKWINVQDHSILLWLKSPHSSCVGDILLSRVSLSVALIISSVPPGDLPGMHLAKQSAASSCRFRPRHVYVDQGRKKQKGADLRLHFDHSIHCHRELTPLDAQAYLHGSRSRRHFQGCRPSFLYDNVLDLQLSTLIWRGRNRVV